VSRDHGRHVPLISEQQHWLKPKSEGDTFFNGLHIIFGVHSKVERVIIKQPPPHSRAGPTPPCFLTAKAVHIEICKKKALRRI